MRSDAATVEEYLESLPEARRGPMRAVRALIRKHLPAGFHETMDWGMISYQVPLAVYPETYNGKPLMYAALASQKGYMVVYLSAIYADASSRERFESAYKATGKRYDVGQSCVRFRTLEDLPLPVIGEAIASTTVERFIEQYEKGRKSAREKKGPSKPRANKKRA